MPLETPYNDRIREQAQQLVPSTFAPVPQLQTPDPQTIMQQMGAMTAPTAPAGPKFPVEVQKAEQSKGSKLTQPELEAIRDRFLVEHVRPNEWQKKGAKKGTVDAAEGAFNSKADRWIQDYLKQQQDNKADGAPKPEGGTIGRFLTGVKDVGVEALNTATVGTVSGLANLEDYKQRLLNAAGFGLAKLVQTGNLGEASKEWDRQRSKSTVFATGIADPLDNVSEWIRTNLLSDRAQGTSKHLGEMLNSDATVGEMADYIKNNPSSVAPIIGDTLGYLSPSFGLGLAGKAGKAVKAAEGVEDATGLIARLAKGGRLSRFGSKVLEQTPAAVASGVAPSGAALGQLRHQIDSIPLDQLIDSSPRNKALYDSLGQFGLKGQELEQAFRGALFNEAQDVTLGGALASNVASAALLGSPAERALALNPTGGLTALAGKQARQSMLRRMLGAGTHEAFEEGAAAIPDTLSQNTAQAQFTGQPQNPTQGLDKNIALSSALGFAFGAGTNISKPKVANPLANSQTEQTGNTNPPPTDSGQGGSTTQTAGAAENAGGNQEPRGVAAIMATPGPGVSKDVHKGMRDGVDAYVARILGKKTVKKRLTDANADYVLDIATAAAMESAGDNWKALSSEQRLSLVERAAGALNKKAKAEGVAESLGALRNTIVAGTNEGVPPGTVPPVAPAAPPPPVETPPAGAQAAPEATPPPPPVTETPPPPPPVTNTGSAAETTASGQAGTSNTNADGTPKAAGLPKALAGAKPRYGNQNGMYLPQFESDIDKAFYIIGQKTKSKADAEYRKFLTEQGYDEASLDGIAAMVRSHVAAQMEGVEAGTNTTPAAVRVPALDIPKNTKAKRPGNTLARPATEAKPASPAKKAAGETKPVEPKPVTKKKNPLKKETTDKETPRPKEQAPAKNKPGQARNAAPSLESADKARARIAPDLIGTDATDVDEALALARQGDATELNSVLKALVADEIITRDQAAQLREAGRSPTPSERGEGARVDGKPATNEAEQETEQDAGDEDVTDEDVTPEPTTDEEPTQVGRDADLAELKRLYVRAVSSTEPTRLPTLLQRMAGLKTLPPHYKWLANKLAQLLANSNVDVRFLPEHEIQQAFLEGRVLYGGFRSAINSLELNAKAFTDANFGAMVVLHEALHAATVNMMIAKAENAVVEKFQKDMESLLAHVRRYVRAHPEIVKSDVVRKNLKVNKSAGFNNAHEFITYGLTYPEYMEILSNIPAPPNSKFSNAWQAFKDIIERLFGTPGGARSALDLLIEYTSHVAEYVAANPDVEERARHAYARGSFSPLLRRNSTLDISKAEGDVAEMSSVVDDADTPAKQKAVAQVLSKADVMRPSNAQRVIEVTAQAGYGLEKAQSLVNKAGGTINSENSPTIAARLYSGQQAENHSVDLHEVVEPIRNWIAENWRRFKVADLEQFRKYLDVFMQERHMLFERNPSIWSEKVELSPVGEIKRLEIIEDALSGKLTGTQADQQLIANAKKYAMQSLEDWAKESPDGRDPSKARDALSKVAKLGFTDNNLQDFDKLWNALTERARQRNLAAGLIAKDDAFATRSWAHYVPLKGSLAVSPGAADYDYGSFKGTTKEFRSRDFAATTGRGSYAGNVMDQMLVDMLQAGSANAEKNFKDALYEFVSDNMKLLGAQIRVWEGTPKGGFEHTYKRGGKKIVRRRPRLPNPLYGFVVSDGRTHYEVILPKGSQLDRGVKGLRKVLSPYSLEDEYAFAGKTFRTVGAVTNFLARARTTWAPWWQVIRGFVRDIQTIPTTIGMTKFDSPWKARRFFVGYARNMVKTLADTSTLGLRLTAVWNNDESTLRDYANDPKNKGTYLYYLQRLTALGGNTHFTQAMTHDKATDILFGKAKQKEAGALSPEAARAAYDKWNDATSNFASFLENMGRVSAFRALLEADPNMTEREAAALTKGALDFGQSGEWGKMINAMHAYYRIGASELDAHRRAFTDANGKIDKGKMFRWYSFMSAMGVVNYMLLSAALGKDDDGVDRLKKMTADTLTQVLPIPTGDGKPFALSIGLGIPQLTLAPGMLAAAMANGHITPEEAGKAYYNTITRNIPLQPLGWKKDTGAIGFLQSWIGALAPTPLIPVTELYTNTNAFDNPIHREHVNDKKFKSDQGLPSTSEGWKDIAKAVHDMTGIDMFPETIKHLTQSYGGQPVGALLRATIDHANDQQDGTVTTAVREVLRTSVNDEDFYYRNQARKVQRTLAAEARVRSHAEDQAKWDRENPDGVKRLQALKVLDKALDAYYKRKKEVRGNSLYSPQGKRDQMKLADAKLREAVNKAQGVIDNTED